MEHVYAPTPDLYDSDTAARVKYHINTLYPLLSNFAKYRCCCKLGLNVIIHPNGQLQIIATLVKTHTCYRLTQDITLNKFIVIKDQLKRAIFEMAQPLMPSSTYEMSTQALQEGVSKTVYSTSRSSVPLAVSVDLKEKVQGI